MDDVVWKNRGPVNQRLLRPLGTFVLLIAAAVSGVLLGFLVFVSSPNDLAVTQMLFASTFLGLLAFGVPCLVVAPLYQHKRVIAGCSVLVCGAALALTYVYGRSDSSTAIFVYGFGVLIGLPVSVGIVFAVRKWATVSSSI